MYDFYSSRNFEKQNTYNGTDLGAVWSKTDTHFRVWAPTADAVWVNLYKSGDPAATDLLVRLPMDRDVKGTWVTHRSGNLEGIYYTYQVQVDGHCVEACDPYARTTGVNGYRAMILDLESTNPEGWDQDKDPHGGNKITDAVLYELHIRDLSMNRSSRIRSKGKFLGLAENGRKTKSGYATGLDHIKSLGVTHVHLLPVYDFGSVDESIPHSKQYNWGYDPVNYNVPEGSYASDPFNGAVRVREMKQLVKALHDNGLSVIMDVVYNHVYKKEEFCFNKIVPGYFSRCNGGIYSNGSCCGNDTASERTMVRKYIVDSVNYWADEYHIDGFRFDLVGLIDTQTINEIMETVHKKHPNVIFYGEGWSMGTALTKPGYTMTTQINSSLVPGFAFFSDTLRDALKGSVFDSSASGYVCGGYCSKDTLEACFMGVPYWAASPDQCVNYVSCHDNHTLFDRISLAAPDTSREDKVRMNNLAAAFCILSQGVPFFQAGEEMLRSKLRRDGKFESNSYKSPDSVNSIKWNTLEEEEYRNVCGYYKGLIAFRKAHPSLRLTDRQAVWDTIHPIHCDNPHTLAFLIDGDEEERIFVAFNADHNGISMTLPDGKWQVCIQNDRAGTQSLQEVGGSITVSPISAMVLTQKKAAKPVDVVAALIWEKDKFLIAQRPATKARGLLWEFVGGKVERGETLPEALVRECREELDITVDVGAPFMQVVHEYPDILIRLSLYHCTIPEGFPKALEHNDIRWIHPRQINEFAFCPADADILKEIKRQYGNKMPL